MKIIVGLGNPGEEYENTRHNAGRIVVRAIQDLTLFEKRTDVKLLESDEYMNNSGRFVRALLEREGADASGLIFVHDDFAFPVGEYRIQFGRGHNGHKGVISVINSLGTKDFWRVRVGIGDVPAGQAGSDYVLSRFKRSELDKLREIVPFVAQGLLSIIEGKEGEK